MSDNLISLSETARRHGVSKSGLWTAAQNDRPIKGMQLHRYVVLGDDGEIRGFDFPDWYEFPGEDEAPEAPRDPARQEDPPRNEQPVQQEQEEAEAGNDRRVWENGTEKVLLLAGEVAMMLGVSTDRVEEAVRSTRPIEGLPLFRWARREEGHRRRLKFFIPAQTIKESDLLQTWEEFEKELRAASKRVAEGKTTEKTSSARSAAAEDPGGTTREGDRAPRENDREPNAGDGPPEEEEPRESGGSHLLQSLATLGGAVGFGVLMEQTS